MRLLRPFNRIIKIFKVSKRRPRGKTKICEGNFKGNIRSQLLSSPGTTTMANAIFLLRMQNTSPDMIMTGYSVILKHQKAEQPQVFTFSPVSILPGSVVDVPLGGLAFVPDAADLASDQFQFGVDGVSGVTLSLN